jgi:hypothetical protein
VSLTTQSDEMTLTLVQPWLAVDGLAWFTIAASLMTLRWRHGKISASLFALGLMPLALRNLLLGLHDAVYWFLLEIYGSSESWDSLTPVLVVLGRLESVGLLLSAGAACFWALRRSQSASA